jgi:ribosomal protein S18 acetylase RimI-like enzyme
MNNIEILGNSPSEEDIQTINMIYVEGFFNKHKHVGLSKEEALKLCKAMFLDDLASDQDNHIFLVSRNQDTRRIEGVSHLTPPQSKEWIQTHLKKKKENQHTTDFFNQLSWMRRIKAQNILIVAEDPYITLSPNEAYVKVLAVDTKGKGIGKTLLEEADRLSKERRGEFISLHVASSNRAQNLYLRQGYKEFKERTFNSFFMRFYLQMVVGEPGFICLRKHL